MGGPGFQGTSADSRGERIVRGRRPSLPAQSRSIRRSRSSIAPSSHRGPSPRRPRRTPAPRAGSSPSGACTRSCSGEPSFAPTLNCRKVSSTFCFTNSCGSPRTSSLPQNREVIHFDFYQGGCVPDSPSVWSSMALRRRFLHFRPVAWLGRATVSRTTTTAAGESPRRRRHPATQGEERRASSRSVRLSAPRQYPETTTPEQLPIEYRSPATTP